MRLFGINYSNINIIRGNIQLVESIYDVIDAKICSKNAVQCLWTLLIYVTDGLTGRSTSAPISALRLILDKDQGLRSGILS